MPKLKTRDASTFVQLTSHAKGLHDTARSKAHMFDDFCAGAKVQQMLRVGRSTECEIRVQDRFVSLVHLVLQRRDDGATLLHDHSSTNGVYIDGQRMAQPVALVVGMRIRIGHSLFIAVDADGSFPIAASTVSEFCRKASKYYGNNCLAAEHVGRSREFVRRQQLPRAQRYKKR